MRRVQGNDNDDGNGDDKIKAECKPVLLKHLGLSILSSLLYK